MAVLCCLLPYGNTRWGFGGLLTIARPASALTALAAVAALTALAAADALAALAAAAAPIRA
jgi:hypothetical protein